VVKVLAVGVGLLLGASASFAQTPAPAEAEQVRARQKIFMMEGVLERAVTLGIDSFRRQLSAVTSDDMMLVSGDGPQARGFRLEGYGVFFDVEVPGVRPSLAWSLRTMNETAGIFARDFERMRAAIAAAVPDAQQRAELERQLVRMQQQVAPPTPAPAQPALAADARAAGSVSAQSVGRPPVPPMPAATGAATPAVLRDPGEVFTQSVAQALIDAMLENSGSLIIAANEWLTVAARDNAQGGRFVASDPSDVMTIVLRVRGSDLAEFQARRLTLDEVRKRVEARAF
jgi:hypothetical protein